MSRKLLLGLAIMVTAAGCPSADSSASDAARARLGIDKDGRAVVPTNQVLSPMGRQVLVDSRPVDLALDAAGRRLAVLSSGEVELIDTATGKVTDRQKLSGGGSYRGVCFSADGKELYVSSMSRTPPGGAITRYAVRGDTLAALAAIPLWTDGSSRTKSYSLVPSGMALGEGGKTLLVALNLGDALGMVDLAAGKTVRQVPVGSAPYDVVRVGAKAYVSNWGGRRPTPTTTTGPSGFGSPVRVDAVRNIASEGSVSVVDLGTAKVVKEIVVGLHASGLAATADGKYVCVANANSDTVSVIATATDQVVETLLTRPAEGMLFGSAPNALAISPDGKRLYVSNGTNNAVAVVAFDPPHSRVLGCLPTGWYPAGLALDAAAGKLYVANIKGVGSRSTRWKGQRKVKGQTVFGYNSRDYLGSVSLIDLPADSKLADLTRTVLANNRQTEMISALAPPRADAPPRPVPQRHGEPSVFQHVLYIIKENRTYDQVFGDLKQGEGDERLCIYGREVTPNQHALAEEFVLLDNFYCSGVLSADGHQWTDEAYVTDYLEKAFGGFPRSYPYDGNDALAYAPTGFLWDNALAHDKTLRIYGEFVKARIRWKDPAHKGTPGFVDCYNDWKDRAGKIDIQALPRIKTIEPYLCPSYTGFPLMVCDQYRADLYLAELKEFERTDRMPNLSILVLPRNHTEGTRPGVPAPEAMVADNDLALGRIVEAISHSRFWATTCIFVVEDDPQNGFDHVDGHRTIAQVISPYTRRHHVDSTNYNQTSMVRTIELALGLPPMNQLDASATPMTNCFVNTPDLRPFQALPNRIPLDRLNSPLKLISDARQKHWAEVSLAMNFDEVDRADENLFNRVLWFAARGRDDNYPDWAVNADEDDDRDAGEGKDRDDDD